MNLYNITDWKIRVFPNGVIPEQFDVSLDQSEVKKELGIHPYAPTIFFVGRMAYQKGPDLLIDALTKVTDAHWGMQIIMTGEGGMRKWLENTAHIRGLNARFPGYISDTEYVRYLHAADLVVIPSLNEPFGIVLPEAWSAGKAVVACDVGGLSENIESYRNGIKVQVSSEELGFGISQALKEPENLDQFGRSGRVKVYREFRWESIAQRIDEWYQGIAS